MSNSVFVFLDSIWSVLSHIGLTQKGYLLCVLKFWYYYLFSQHPEFGLQKDILNSFVEQGFVNGYCFD